MQLQRRVQSNLSLSLPNLSLFDLHQVEPIERNYYDSVRLRREKERKYSEKRKE